MKKSLYLGFVTLTVAMSVVFTACKDDDPEPPATDNRVALTAVAATVNAAATATGASAQFAGAAGLGLTADDFTVSTGANIGTGTLAVDDDGVITVPITFPSNATGGTTKTYTVSIAEGSTKIKGNAAVAIIQAAGNSQQPEDGTAPTLTPGTSVPTADGGTVKFTSNEAGTYYYLVYLASVQNGPDAATIKAQADGANVKAKGSATATTSETSIAVSGLDASTDYKAYIIVEDAAENKSEVLTIAFSTTAPADGTAPTLTPGTSVPTANGGTVKFTSNEAGTYYYLVYLASVQNGPDAATIKAQADGTDVKAKGSAAATTSETSIAVSGLDASTNYKAYIIVEDAAENKSDVLSIAFSTTANG
ncbi:MAG: hypothetical protein LBQ77_00555 [Treponema sp.]|jgi:hypothetical protein|nr:hypothetical protein [Treponema sp.]